MATKLIVITKTEIGARRIANFVMRANVPAARQALYANPAYVSLWPGTDAQDQLDLAALKAGALVEVAGTYSDPMVNSTQQTLPQFLASILAVQAAYQSQITNEKTFNFYGSFYDGAWTQAGA